MVQSDASEVERERQIGMSDQEFRFTRGDMIKGSVVAFMLRMQSRRSIIYQAVAVLVYATVLSLIFERGTLRAGDWFVAAVIMVCMLAVGHILMMLFSVWWGSRLLARHPHLRHRFRTNIGAEGVGLIGSNGRWTYQWTDFTDMFEGREIFVLMLGPSMFLALPKHVLDPAEIEALRRNMRR